MLKTKNYVRCVSKPKFISQKIFSNTFVVIYQIKSVITLDKPIYVGFSDLELNKLLILNSIMGTLKINLILNYCLQILTA